MTTDITSFSQEWLHKTLFGIGSNIPIIYIYIVVVTIIWRVKNWGEGG